MIRHGTSAEVLLCKQGPYNLLDQAFREGLALSDSTAASDMTPDSRPSGDAVPSAIQSVSAPDTALAYERAARTRAEAQVFGRDQILSVASHDLRGPLNAIHTWAHVLERKIGEADASIGRALAGIRAGVEQQVALIEKIIDAPRMATRHLAITRRPVSLRPLCEDAIANARLTQGAGEIRLEWSGEARAADADADRLWQAWWCILAYARELGVLAADNAASLAAIGAPSQERVLRVSNDQGNCVTALTTAAPALERAVLERNLALPRRVAEAHGGHCSIEPNEESGELTITMVLPIVGRG